MNIHVDDVVLFSDGKVGLVSYRNTTKEPNGLVSYDPKYGLLIDWPEYLDSVIRKISTKKMNVVLLS